MKINKRALEVLKNFDLTGDKIVPIFKDLMKGMTSEMGEVEMTIGFDKDGAIPDGELLPEITFRLKEKGAVEVI